MPFGSFVVSESLFAALADVSHLGFVFSVHISSSFERVKSSWSLPSIDSSFRGAVAAARCSNISVSSFESTTVVAACFCSSAPATSFAADMFLITCCCSMISDSSFAAAAVFVCSSRISFSPLVAAIVVFVCFRKRISRHRVLLKNFRTIVSCCIQVFPIPRVLQWSSSFRSSISDSSCAATSCTPGNLFLSSSSLCQTSCIFSDELGHLVAPLK